MHSVFQIHLTPEFFPTEHLHPGLCSLGCIALGLGGWGWSCGFRAFSDLWSFLLFPESNRVVFHYGLLPRVLMFPISVVRPFRKVNEKGVLLWDKIHKLQKGQIYKQVSCDQFIFFVPLLTGQLQ